MAALRLLAALLLAAAAVAGAAEPPVPTAEWLLGLVRTLAAPETEGRGSGTPGADRAARHIADELRAAGLRTELQSFPVPTGIRLGPVNTLSVLGPAPQALALGRDWAPLPVSADGAVEGEVVFAGYGITAPDLGWDDYAGLDARGKVVLVLGGDPRPADPGTPFRRPEAYHYAERSHKIINAREHGARAILLVAHPGAPDEALPPLAGIAQPSSIAALVLTRAAADLLLAPAGTRLGELAEAIDRPLQPRAQALAGVRAGLEISLVRERGTAVNVVGVLPGTDPRLAREAIVLGAHYDHLGHGGEGSLAPDQVGAVHPGADDNASGTAAVLGLARAFAAAGGAPRTLVFVLFAGEETGLLGSAHYVKHPVHPLEATVLMLNLDMVGRPHGGRLYVGGVDGGTGLRALVGSLPAPGLSLVLRGDPFARSDHTSFYAAGQPVLFFFTGAHADYHRPSDTWDKIDAPGLAAVTAFVARVVAAVAAAPTPPAYVGVAAAPAPERERAGYGPFFGLIPEFGETAAPGVRVGGVRPGSPAEQAGVRTGDVLVRFGGVTVKTLEDFAFALRRHRAGEGVDVVVRRDGAERRLRAVLGERR
ncbi:MAG: M20/M25/M40 family metallo-hydrolase [Candidatus Rokubacteria bacterium]|nr:M20/M25/M40 family metallo-hydrolase [Candidatus Rokubacteria bacterium]